MTDRDGDMRIPKIPGQVKLELRDGSWITGSVFLSPRTELHQGPEQIHDILHRDEDYFPVLCEAGGVRMVQRMAIIQLRLGRKEGEREVDPAGILEKVGVFYPVRVALCTGETLTGEFPIFPGIAHDIRVLDWLNLKHEFVPLLTKEMLVYIAHSQIMWAEEIKPA